MNMTTIDAARAAARDTAPPTRRGRLDADIKGLLAALIVLCPAVYSGNGGVCSSGSQLWSIFSLITDTGRS